jgi:raffinose/stachyose/melibiose transport system substrate-binding protein
MINRKLALKALASAAVVGMALTGCSTIAETESGKTRLVVSTSSPQHLVPVEAAFEAEYPDIDMVVPPIGAEGYNSIMQTQLASGAGPDIFGIFPGTGESLTNKVLAERGFIKELKGDWIDQIPASMQRLYRMDDGKVFAAPGSTASVGILWNHTALEKIGAEPAATISEVFDLCKLARSNGLPLFSVGAKDAWSGQTLSFALAAQLVYGPDPDFNAKLAAGEATFADSKWVDVYELNKKLIDNECFQDGPTGIGFDEARKMVTDGRSVAMVNYGRVAKAEAESPGTVFTYTHFPATDDPEYKMMALDSSTGFAINAKTKESEAAQKFIDFITSDTGQAAYAYGSGLLPTLPSPSFEADETGRMLLDAIEAGYARPFASADWANLSVAETLFVEVQNLYVGKTTPRQVTERMDEAYTGD